VITLAGRAELEMTQADSEALIRVEQTLKKLNLSLFCTRCHALGNPDGVKAANHPSDHTWLVECGCSLRIQRRHHDPASR
jgi:hypothetical protein